MENVDVGLSTVFVFTSVRQSLHEKRYQALLSNQTGTCPKCPKTFSSYTKLRVHLTGVHVQHSLTCTVCERRFAFTSVLAMHMRTHTGEKLFRCTVCKKTFAQPRALNLHRRMHSRQNHTSVRQAKFVRPVNLQVHERPHDQEQACRVKICSVELIKLNTYV